MAHNSSAMLGFVTTLTHANGFNSKFRFLPNSSIMSPKNKCKARLIFIKTCSVSTSECQDPLGMENGAINDGQISASTQWDANHAAKQGRLNFQAVPGKAGSWSARANDVNQWLQIDLGNPNTKVTGVASQGRNANGQRVTKYKLQYSHDGVNFQYYTEHGVKVK